MSHPLIRYILRRLAWLPLILFAVSVLTFGLLRLLPGNPVYQLVGPGASQSTIRTVEAQLGLDQSLMTQYGTYVGRVLRGDFGESYYTGQSVASELGRRLPATVELVLFSVILATVAALAVALLATRGDRLGRGISRGMTAVSLAMPEFWLGLLLAFVFFFQLGVAPAPLGRLGVVSVPPPRATGFYTVDSLLARDLGLFFEAVSYLALPVITLAFVILGPIAKVSMAVLEEVKESPFMFFARANGLSKAILRRHAIRGALPPIITIIGQQTAYVISGAALIETVFGWGGLGQYAVESILGSDFNAVQAVVIVTAAFTVLIYLLVDIVHGFLDPRTLRR